jgi:tRNA pseudouridine55 synthase
VVVVDKPAGPTSHDMVDRVRRALGERRVGHTGTLDPFATGVLPVCVGKATRLVRFLAKGDKVYEATVRLGYATTTDDLTGEALGPLRPVVIEDSMLRSALRGLNGPLDQLPPAYSAKHLQGKRMYELAREGARVTPAPSRVTVHEIRLLEVAGDLLRIEVRCSPGTYIRAIARDLGEALGCGGHLSGLRRTRTGTFGLEHAVPGDALDGSVRERLLPLRDCLLEWPAVHVTEEGRRALRHGRDLSRELVATGFPEGVPAEWYRVVDEEGELLALAVARGFDVVAGPGPTLHPDVVLLTA